MSHPLTNGEAHPDCPPQQQAQTGDIVDTPSAGFDGHVQHPTAAVFDPEAAKEAAAADQAAGAAVEDPADVLSQPDQAAADAGTGKAISSTLPAAAADSTTKPETTSSKAQPNRSSSRQAQKAIPWR